MIRYQVIKFLKVKNVKDLKFNGGATKEIGVEKVGISDLQYLRTNRLRDVMDSFFTVEF